MYFPVELNTSKTHFFRMSLKNGISLTQIFIVRSYNIFRNALLNFIRPVDRKIYNINDPSGIKMLAKLELGLEVFYKKAVL